jgi:hypothetical protein
MKTKLKMFEIVTDSDKLHWFNKSPKSIRSVPAELTGVCAYACVYVHIHVHILTYIGT